MNVFTIRDVKIQFFVMLKEIRHKRVKNLFKWKKENAVQKILGIMLLKIGFVLRRVLSLWLTVYAFLSRDDDLSLFEITIYEN